MFNLLKSEAYKLKTSKEFYVTSAVIFAVSLIPLIMFNIISKDSGMVNLFGKASLINCLNDDSLMMLIMGIFAAFYITKEFSSGYIRNYLSFGHKKINIIISKSLFYYIGIVAIALIYTLVITVTNTIIHGYGEAFTINSFWYLLRILTFSMVINIALASIAVAIAFVFREVGLTIGIFTGLTFGIKIIIPLASQIEILRKIFEKTIFTQLPIALSDNITFSQGMQVVGISLGTILLSTMIAIWAFNKKDIK